jgi:hypothetical protein
MSEDAAFDFIRGASLLIPPLAIGAYLAIGRWLIRWQRFSLLGCVAVAAITLLLFALRISFTVVVANVCAIMVAYFAYCYIAVACWRITRPLFRGVAVAIAAIPIAIGYFLGTIGVLALALMVGDHVRPPEHIEQLQQGLTCRITTWGWIPMSGQTVHLVRSWVHLPYIEREVARIVVVDGSGDTAASCSNVRLGRDSELALERTRGVVFVEHRRESMNLDQAASIRSAPPLNWDVRPICHRETRKS